MDTIHFEDMLRLLDSKAECTIKYVTLDVKKQEGGEIATIKGVQTGWYNTEPKPKGNTGPRQQKPRPRPKRDPKHFAHGTRNICLSGTGKTVKVIIWLIKEINGKTVIV